jgi:hypothetical protein
MAWDSDTFQDSTLPSPRGDNSPSRPGQIGKGNAKLKKNKRIVSLDSSLDLRRELAKKNPKMGNLRSQSTGSNSQMSNNTNNNTLMQRLDFETIEVGNTPLSSLRSCSEFNRYNSNTGNKSKGNSEKS